MRRPTSKALIVIIASVIIVVFLYGICTYNRPHATQQALGLKVELLDCQGSSDNRVEVSFKITSIRGPMPDFGIGDLGIESSDGEGVLVDTYRTSGSGPCMMKATFDLTEHARSIKMSLPVYIHRANKIASFRFVNVTPASLPQTRTVQGYRVTLTTVLKNCMPQDFSGEDWDIFRIYCNHHIEKRNQFFGLKLETMLRQDFEDYPQPLIDSTGRKIKLERVFAQMISTNSISLEPTTLEKVVSGISPDLANNMMDDRMLAPTRPTMSHVHPNGKYIYAYPMEKKPKGSFTFELKGRLPADQKDTAVVVFDNVPIR